MKKLILSTVITLAISACSTSDSGKALEDWKNYGLDNLSTHQLLPKQALAVFYRTADFQAPALNIYINGDYHTSLIEKSFTSAVVCTSPQFITASYSSNQKFGHRTGGHRYTLATEDITYFRATKDDAGQPVFEQVTSSVAKDELAKLNGKAIHTLPRTKDSKTCENTKSY